MVDFRTCISNLRITITFFNNLAVKLALKITGRLQVNNIKIGVDCST